MFYKFDNIKNLYNVSYSQAYDINYLNCNIIDKLFKKELKKKLNYDKISFKEGPIGIQKWILEKMIKMIKSEELAYRTFFLNKNKGLNSIGNFRIIAISSMIFKLYE